MESKQWLEGEGLRGEKIQESKLPCFQIYYKRCNFTIVAVTHFLESLQHLP